MVLAAANDAGGHSTLDTLITIVILVWAIAGAVVAVGWVVRRVTRRPHRSGDRTSGVGHTLLTWLRAKAARDRILGRFMPGPEPPVPDAPSPPRHHEQPTTGAAHVTPAPAIAPPTNAPEQDSSRLGAPAAGAGPANPGASCSPETLEPLGQHLDGSRRLAVVEERLVPVLGKLPRDRWLVERYVMFAGHRIPFLILGEAGVFALWALGGQPRWSDIPAIGRMADEIRKVLPGYTGNVQTGICRSLASDVEPRWWCRQGESGTWVMGLNWVIPWLEHFGPEHGLGVKDVARLRELAGPRWGRGVTDLPPSALVPEIGQVIPG
jgi:hypothetical protein